MGKISDMTLVAASTATMETEVNDNFTTKKQTNQQIKDFVLDSEVIQLSGTTTDAATPVLLLVNGVDNLQIPDETVWWVKGEGVALSENGDIGYFRIEAMMKNIAGGTDIHLNFVKIIAGGTSVGVSAGGTTNANATATANEETLGLGKGYPDGTVSVDNALGFGFSTAKITVTSVSDILAIVANGDAATSITWKAKLNITKIANPY